MKYYLNQQGRKIYFHEVGQRLYGNFYVFEKDGTVGIQTDRFEIIIPPVYQAIKPAFPQHFWGKTVEGWVLYSFGNRCISTKHYHKVTPFRMQFARVSSDGRNFGFIDRKGEIVIPEIYCDGAFLGLTYFAVAVMKNGKKSYGVIDRSGKIIRPFTLKRMPSFSETVLYLLKQRKPLREWLGI